MDQNKTTKEQEASEQLPTEQTTTTKKDRRNLVFSTSALICIALALVFYLIANLPAFSSFFGKIINLLNPLLWGALIAYLCNPVLSFFERTILKKVSSFHFKRMLGIVFTYLFIIILVAIFGLVLIPSLVESVKTLISNFENYIANAVTYVNYLASSILSALPEGTLDNADELLSMDAIVSFGQELISKVGGLFDDLIANIASYASRLISGVTDVILAVFISFYLLSSKELRAAQVKKVMTAFCSEKTCKFAFNTATMVNRTFGHYFSGVILDAMIIFIVGLIVFSILDIPLALMIAFIVAITNIIPVFGPFLGAVPSAFIIFIIDPTKTLPFIIAILIMQQVDGNIIAPRILGQSTGISSLCVIVSLAIMGGLWGVFGMVVGVPIFAVLVTLIKQFAEAKLAKKNLSTDLDDYYPMIEELSEDHPHRKNIWHRIFIRIKKGATHLMSACSGLFLGLKARLQQIKSRPNKVEKTNEFPTAEDDTANSSDTTAKVFPEGAKHEHE